MATAPMGNDVRVANFRHPPGVWLNAANVFPSAEMRRAPLTFSPPAGIVFAIRAAMTTAAGCKRPNGV
ncbi:hypothetical protein [Sodalis sp. (in: enterobacteria)]|uniref:hypothetical protein n=1 Tax=Sodalis sp. (in: enterobacteria) TaxID=1898979 RepID=UPI003F3F2675